MNIRNALHMLRMHKLAKKKGVPVGKLTFKDLVDTMSKRKRREYRAQQDKALTTWLRQFGLDKAADTIEKSRSL